jgi:hypothetical protein
VDKADFDDYFQILDKASDRARSVLYTFIIINIALLMYSVNVFTYPVQQYSFDDINLEARCRYEKAAPNPSSSDTKCDRIREDLARVTASPQLAMELEQQFWSHQLDLFYDKSVALRTFKAPILGLETDRDLLWLIFPLLSIIGYFIVWSAFIRFGTLFRFLLLHNERDAMRIRRIQSTVVISAPLSGSDSSDITPFYLTLWRFVATVVFAIPIIVSLLMLADQTNAIAAYIRRIPNERFLKYSSTPFLTQLAIECGLLLLQIGLFTKFYQFGISFGRDQDEAERILAKLDDSVASQPG